MGKLITLRAHAQRSGAPALAILLETIAADLMGRGYVNSTERRLLLRGLACCETRLVDLYRRAVDAVEELVGEAVEMRKAA